jgi:hypothetical protein
MQIRIFMHAKSSRHGCPLQNMHRSLQSALKNAHALIIHTSIQTEHQGRGLNDRYVHHHVGSLPLSKSYSQEPHGTLGALKSHPTMLFSTKLYKGRYQDLGTFDRRKVQKNHLMNCRLAVQLFGVALRGAETQRVPSTQALVRESVPLAQGPQTGNSNHELDQLACKS